MPPKKSRRIAQRGIQKKTARTEPAPSPKRSSSSSDTNSEDESRFRTRDDSNDSPVESLAASATPVAESEESFSTQIQQKRTKKSQYCLQIEEEKSMLDFFSENPMLWDIKLTDFRRTDKKNKLWAEQAEIMGKTAEYLKGWYKSLRDIYTRLDKKKSGDGAPELTEREQWVKDNFRFIKAHTRHRPEPVKSVSVILQNDI